MHCCAVEKDDGGAEKSTIPPLRVNEAGGVVDGGRSRDVKWYPENSY